MAASTSPSSFLLLAPCPHRRPGAVRCRGAGRWPGHLPGRRQSLLLLLSAAAPSPALAQDVPLFGLRKKLEKIEEGAEEIVREGEKAVEEGIEAAEKEIQVAEKEIGAAAAGLELGLGGDLVQAGAVAAAEAVGVLAAVSVVNGILGPEGRKS